MTAGHPGDGIADKVQADIVVAKDHCALADRDSAYQLHPECGQGTHREFH